MSVVYGEQQRQGSAFGVSAPGGGSQRDLERQYHVVLQDSLGHPALGFRDGTWWRLSVTGPQALQLRGAIRTCPHAAGSIVQIACWWMRENPMQPRSLDLATELALTVGELVRVCPADGLGNSSMDLLPMAMAAVAQSTPSAPAQPALPAGTGSGEAFGAGAPFGSQGSSFANGSQTYGANGTTYGAAAASGTSYGTSTANGTTYGATAANGTTYGATAANGTTYGATAANGTSYGTSTANGSSYETTTANGTYSTSTANGSSYNSPTAAATNHAPASSGSWFDSSDTTGTGGFPAVPPAPVVGRTAAPSQQSTPPRPAASYPPAPRGYGAAAAPQAALPPSRGYSDAAGEDWERPATPRRPPSHQPRPQQAVAPRPVPGASANGQVPRPRPVPPRDDRRDTFERRLGLEEQESLGRSSDRNNGVPPRRPAPAQAQRQRGTMGQRPASRPGRPSDW